MPLIVSMSLSQATDTAEFRAILNRKEKGDWQGLGVGFAAGRGLLADSKVERGLRLRAESLKAVRWGLKVERLGSLRG